MNGAALSRPRASSNLAGLITIDSLDKGAVAHCATGLPQIPLKFQTGFSAVLNGESCYEKTKQK